MDPTLLVLILKDVVVPEVASFISAHYAKTGELPTQEELQAQIDSQSAAIIQKAQGLIAQIVKDHPELS